MRRTGIAVLLAAAVGLSVASPALAYPVPPPTVTCHLDSVQAGGNVGISGHNWLADSSVVLTLQSNPVFLGTEQTDSNGTFSTTVQIPSDTTPGQHQIVGTGRDQNGDPAQASCPIVVTAAGAGPGGVAFTGTNVSLGLIILAVLVVAGLGFLVAGRRRKAHAE
jgi:hypothetical protein